MYAALFVKAISLNRCGGRKVRCQYHRPCRDILRFCTRCSMPNKTVNEQGLSSKFKLPPGRIGPLFANNIFYYCPFESFQLNTYCHYRAKECSPANWSHIALIGFTCAVLIIFYVVLEMQDCNQIKICSNRACKIRFGVDCSYH